MSDEATVYLAIHEDVDYRNAFFYADKSAITVAFLRHFAFLVNHSVGTPLMLYQYFQQKQKTASGIFNKYDSSILKGSIEVDGVLSIPYTLSIHSRSIQFSNITFTDPVDGIKYVIDATFLMYMNKSGGKYRFGSQQRYSISFFEAFLGKKLKTVPNSTTYKFIPEVREFLATYTDYEEYLA